MAVLEQFRNQTTNHLV